MRKSIIIAIAAAIIASVNGCKKQDETAKGGLVIAVSVFPIYDIARNVCGDKARIFFTIAAGADPHTFEPRPSVARDLEGSTLFIGVTPEFDGWMERFLPNTARREYLIEKSNAGHEENPHIWLSVRRAKTIAALVARYAAEADPANRVFYEKNLAAYAKRLDELDRAIISLFRHKKIKSFIQWHEAWGYFAADYGLTIAGTVNREGSERASVRSIAEIVEKARAGGVSVIAVSLDSEKKNARVLAQEINGVIVQLDGIGNPDSEDRSDYIKLMRYNAATLAGALR